MQRPPGREIARITLGVLFIGLLIAVSLLVLQPFLGALVWATMIVVATWPMMLAVQARLGGRRWAAVLVMTVVMLLLLVIPLTVAVLTIVENANIIMAWAQSLAGTGVPAPPQWVADLPLVGSKIAAEWTALAAASREDLMAQVVPYMRTVIQWFAGRAGGVGLTLLHFLLTVVITAILYANGEAAALGARRFGRRLADERGESSVILAGQAIRAVALGIVVTAIAQAIAAGIGLALCGVPYAAVLTAITFILCIAQIPPLLVLLPAVGWLYWSDNTLWGTVLLLWSLPVAVMDNFLRPVLIKRGADLPLLLIFAGVIGGLIGFGIIGLFVGPVVLAVTYRLLEAWIADVDQPNLLTQAAPSPNPGATTEV